jgi:hypothetical protein
MLSKDKMLAM